MASAPTKRTPAKKAVKAASAAAASAPAPVADLPAAGPVADLAGGLRTLLGELEREVRAVSALSDRIDGLVTDLNGVRAEQAQRLLALDALRSSAEDGGLISFLDKLIRPGLPRVAEVVPERLALP